MLENERLIGLLTTVSQSANQAGTGAAKPQPGHHCLLMQLTTAGFFHLEVESFTKNDCHDSNNVESDSGFLLFFLLSGNCFKLISIPETVTPLIPLTCTVKQKASTTSLHLHTYTFALRSQVVVFFLRV